MVEEPKLPKKWLPNPVDTDALFGDYEIERSLPGTEDEMSDQEHVFVAMAEDDAKTGPRRIKAKPDDIDRSLYQAERRLARLDERFQLDPKRKHRAALLASVREASWMSWLESESRYTGERRVLKWWAFDGLYGDKFAEVELLEDAADIANAIIWRNERKPSLADMSLLQLASKAYQRRQVREAKERTAFLLEAAENRSLPALFTASELQDIRSAIGDYGNDEVDGLFGAAHRHARLLTHALRHVDAEKELLVRGEIHGQKIESTGATAQGVLWFRTCILLGPTIIAKSCELPCSPVLPIAYAAARTGAIWSLLSESKQQIDPVRLTEAYTFAVEELGRIDQVMEAGWQNAQELITRSKGAMMSNIVELLFDKGRITIAEVVKKWGVSPQAAHYQLNRLMEQRVVERFTSGKDGGHYFLRCLVQATQ
ncbi:MAG: winged helix-turn-helix transcriptional regulator [Porticoccaceae bacterium]